MFEIRHATAADHAFWLTLDPHLSAPEFLLKVRDKRAYLIQGGGEPLGVMRYQLLWDQTPFLTLIHIAAARRGRG